MREFKVIVEIVKDRNDSAEKDVWTGQAGDKREARKMAQAHFHDLYPGCHVSVYSTKLAK